MLDFLETKARDLNMETMTIRVMPKNEPAKLLYEKKGFELKGTSKWGSLMMEKKLL
jgi:ribosomal protein S18 acetylase RimI-like enzyme